MGLTVLAKVKPVPIFHAERCTWMQNTNNIKTPRSSVVNVTKMIHWWLEVNIVNHVQGKCNMKNWLSRLKLFFWSKLLTDFHKTCTKLGCVVNCCGYITSSFMMTPSTENIFHVAGFWNPPVDSPHTGQWHGTLMFLWSAPEQTHGQTIETPVSWGAIAPTMTSL